MRKLFGVIFVSISMLCFASALSLVEIKEPACAASSTTGVTSVSRDGFGITSQCVHGEASSTYTVKGVVTDKYTFDKAYGVYKLYGNVCEKGDMGEKVDTVNGVLFKKVCGAVGAFPTYFVDGKQASTFEAFGNAVLVSGFKQSLTSLIDMSKNGPICDAATSTIQSYGDKMLRSLCTPGKPAVYSVDGATTTFGAYAKEQLTSENLLCAKGATTTTNYAFASHVLQRTCTGRDVVGVLYVDGATTTFSQFSSLYKKLTQNESVKIEEVYKTTVASTTTTFKSSCQGLLAVQKSLIYGTKSKEVLEVQKKLEELGYLKAVPNGYYGNATRAAVKAYQEAQTLPITGTVGRLTLSALKSVCGKM
jgi:hypothetical protein